MVDLLLPPQPIRGNINAQGSQRLREGTRRKSGLSILLGCFTCGRIDDFRKPQGCRLVVGEAYNRPMQRKIFWVVFILLGLLADFLLPFWWAFFSTIPIIVVSWWVAYRSDWF